MNQGVSVWPHVMDGSKWKEEADFVSGKDALHCHNVVDATVQGSSCAWIYKPK